MDPDAPPLGHHNSAGEPSGFPTQQQLQQHQPLISPSPEHNLVRPIAIVGGAERQMVNTAGGDAPPQSGSPSGRENRSMLLAQAAAANNNINYREVQQASPKGASKVASPVARPPAVAEEDPPILRVGDVLRNWVITNRIGGGAFGETYTAVSTQAEPGKGGALAGKDDRTGNQEVCIKVERNDKRMVLRLEVLALKKVQACPSVVRYVSSGRQDDVNFLVMEKLGENLSELRRLTPNGAFELYTVLHIGICCLQAIQGIHQLGLVHRDIKPSNFVIGNTPETRRRVYLIDFGLAKRYRSSNGELKPARDNAGFRGTSRYASLNSHNHKELGRVDDLWSLLFMLVEFITGTLPWRKAKEKEVIAELKLAHVGPQLVSKLPREFTPFVHELMKLEYESEPDYDLLIELLHRCRKRREYPEYKNLDWEVGSSIPGLSTQTSRDVLPNPAVGAMMDPPPIAATPAKFPTDAVLAGAGINVGGAQNQAETPQLGPPEKKKPRKTKQEKKDKEARRAEKKKALGQSGGDPEAQPAPLVYEHAPSYQAPPPPPPTGEPQYQQQPPFYPAEVMQHQFQVAGHPAGFPQQAQPTFVDQMGHPPTFSAAGEPGLFGPPRVPPPPPQHAVGTVPIQLQLRVATNGGYQSPAPGPAGYPMVVPLNMSGFENENEEEVPPPWNGETAALPVEADPISPPLAISSPPPAGLEASPHLLNIHTGDPDQRRASGEMSEVLLYTPTQSQVGLIGFQGQDPRLADSSMNLNSPEPVVQEQQEQQQPLAYNPVPVAPMPQVLAPELLDTAVHAPQPGQPPEPVPNALLRPLDATGDYSNAEIPTPRGNDEGEEHPLAPMEQLPTPGSVGRDPDGLPIPPSAGGSPHGFPQQRVGGGGASAGAGSAPGPVYSPQTAEDEDEALGSPGATPRTPVQREAKERKAVPPNQIAGESSGTGSPAGPATPKNGAASGTTPIKNNSNNIGGNRKSSKVDAEGFSELADAEADAIPSIGEEPCESKRVAKDDGCGCCSMM